MADNDVTRYIASTPEVQRQTLEYLRALIRQHLPEAQELVGSSGFPIYTHQEVWVAGFATRKKCAMLYIMCPGVLDEFDQDMGRLRSGKSCMEWRPGKKISDTELRDLARRIVARAAESITRR